MSRVPEYPPPRLYKRVIIVEVHSCERCSHEWIPRKADAPPAKTCPKCKSPYWDKPRRTKKGGEA